MRWTSATLRTAVVLLACFAASLADAASFKRRALVIANTGYVHTAALKNPQLISTLARRYGSQAVIVAIDAKRDANVMAIR